MAGFFAGDFDEVQGRHAENPSLGAVHSRFTDQNLQNLIAFQRLGHVDEVDDDDAADIAQAQLASDFDGRFFIDVKNRILKGRPVARILAAVDVDDGQGFRMIDDQVAPRRQGYDA